MFYVRWLEANISARFTLTDMASPCIFFARGACKRGKDCAFTHADQKHAGLHRQQLRGDATLFTPGSTFVSAQSSTSAGPGCIKALPICHFYVQSRCRNGNVCKFRHDGPMQQIAGPEVGIQEERAQVGANDDKHFVEVGYPNIRCKPLASDVLGHKSTRAE